MNKLLQVMFVVLSFTIVVESANAGSCEVPAFLQVGKTYTIVFDKTKNFKKGVKVLAVSQCWIKVNIDNREGWLNVNQMQAMSLDK